MTQVPSEFIDLLPKLSSKENDDPIYWLWVYDPSEDKVHLEHNRRRHRADHITHEELADRVLHPERIHGYAYRIKGGFRITDWDHKPLKDPHILKSVQSALKDDPSPPNNHSGNVIQLRAMKV